MYNIKIYFDNTITNNKYITNLIFKKCIEQNYKFLLKYYFKFLFLNNPESILNINCASNLRKNLANHINFITNSWDFDVIIPLTELVFLTALNLAYLTNKPIVQIFTNKLFLEGKNNMIIQNLLSMIRNKNILIISNYIIPSDDLKELITKLKKNSKKTNYVSCSPFYLAKNELTINNKFDILQTDLIINNFNFINLDYIADILRLK